MHVQNLDEQDVAALARASGVDATSERIASLAATLPIVNSIRAMLWARPRGLESEPAHLFAPARGEVTE